MTRRELFHLAAAAAAPSSNPFEKWFLTILDGYLANLIRTSPSLAVCDFKDGTIKEGATGKSGKTYDSVTRMMPALAAWVASGRKPSAFDVGGKRMELADVLAETFRNAFDPKHPDYWLPSPEQKQQQRQVEASIVAWSLWLASEQILPRLSAAERRNAQAWLESCAKVPVRANNWAWFTAVNIGARLALREKWPEFSADQMFMLEDLAALDKMAAPGADGWYSDSLREQVYDYYNFWVFASHFLYWNKMAGAQYPSWRRRFEERLRAFLEKTPYFFGANGCHVLFGRSLIYRWAVLTPLVLAYEQKLWPHSPGLLRRICRANIEYQWKIGGYDAERGKLRESLTPEGTREICESYIDNGHPYWGMQAFALFLIPPRDPFWTAPEDPLPVERRSFTVRFEGPKMLLAGEQRTGEVRWLQSINGHNAPDYRDKYTKFTYSSHFPFSILKDKTRCVWDNVLVFRDPASDAMAGRSAMLGGGLLADGVERKWSVALGGRKIEVASVLRIDGEFEYRRHLIEGAEGLEALEGSYPLGLGSSEEFTALDWAGGKAIQKRGGALVALWPVAGWKAVGVDEQTGVNIVYPRAAVATLRVTIPAGGARLESIHYASPSALPRAAILQKLDELRRRFAGGV